MGMNWLPDKVENLKRLYGLGYSATGIAAEMGNGITRNAVIGKIHRLGLAIHADPTCLARVKAKAKLRADRDRGATQRIARSLPIKPSRLQPDGPPLVIEPTKAEGPPPAEFLGIPFQKLEWDSCRWPHGEGAQITFCGRRTLEGFSYCPGCYRKSIDPRAPKTQEARA